MIASLQAFSARRTGWLLLAASVLAFELCGLYFEHVMHLQPCVLCIDERIAFLGILAAALLALINPRWFILRWGALLLWGFSALRGLQLALHHTDLQLHPSPFKACPLFPTFPGDLPLDRWMPWMFQATGDCSERQWSFLTWEMPQWLIPIFGAYLLVALVIALVNLRRGNCCS